MARAKKQNQKKLSPIIIILLVIALFFGGGYLYENYFSGDYASFSYNDVPAYSGEAYVEINGNIPFFTDEEITTKSYEFYSELDGLGRCRYAMACIGKDLMPTEERDDIKAVEPTGWKQASYDSVPGKYLYDRCHLIGFQLTGENANEKNLITGTGYMNVTGMLPFENRIAEYVEDPGNHVMYRVTPIFESYDFVARGVLMEAYSVEDKGAGIRFCVFCYNVQPGICIDYYDGRSWLDGDSPPPALDEGEGDGDETGNPDTDGITYILNTSSKKIHLPDCRYASDMKEENRQETTKSLKTLTEQDGYKACGTCKPDVKQQ